MANVIWDRRPEQFSVRQARAARLSGRAAAALFGEVAALGALLLGVFMHGAMKSHAAQNAAPLWFRLCSLALPLAGAASVVIGSALWVRDRRDRAQLLQVWIRGGAPLLALWPAPVLLDKKPSRTDPCLSFLRARRWRSVWSAACATLRRVIRVS